MQCFLDLAVIGHEILISRSNILNLLQKSLVSESVPDVM